MAAATRNAASATEVQVSTTAEYANRLVVDATASNYSWYQTPLYSWHYYLATITAFIGAINEVIVAE